LVAPKHRFLLVHPAVLVCYGQHPGVRANHATGAVFEGVFTPAQGAATLSSAAFLIGAPTPLTIRFSNAGGVPDAPDTDPSTDRVRGMAIKFRLADGSEADIISISVNGFPAATGEDFLALLQAAGASGPDVPKPTPVEKFLSTHPAAVAFVTAPKPVAVSYGTQPFFGVNAFKFTNAQGASKFGRYRIVPESGPAYVSDGRRRGVLRTRWPTICGHRSKKNQSSSAFW
jgi:catalase